MVFPYIILGGTMRVAGGPYSIVTNLSGVSTGGLVAYTKLVTPILNSSFASVSDTHLVLQMVFWKREFLTEVSHV